MSGLSLASHPRLAGAGRHRFGANHVVCALALCALVLRARPCGGFACFASCRGAAPLFCAHTSLLAHALWRGRESVCACGAAPVVGVFACGWLGFGVCATARVRVGVCVLWCWRFGGVVGQCGPAAPAPARLGWLVLTSLVWACWRVRGWRVRGGRVGGLVGAGHGCPAPYCVAWATSVAPWRGRERRGVWGAPGVLTRAHTQREVRERGEPRGADGGGLAGGGGAYSWCVLLVHTTPPPGSAGGQRERGGEPPAGRVGLAGGGGYLFLVVTLLPLGVWVVLGRGAFLLVVGLGWW